MTAIAKKAAALNFDRIDRIEAEAGKPSVSVAAPTDKGAYARLVEIIRANTSNVLSDRRLAFNQMSGEMMLGDIVVDDVVIDQVRESIETNVINAKGKAARAGTANTRAAIQQVAHETTFHPVQRYLNGLKWDGVKRIEKIAPEVLGAARDISATLVKRFFVSAAARAMRPGCKCDTALILVGDQGFFKSTFFKILGGDWFSDSPVSIGSKDAFEVLRRCWIIELAELEGLKRARDVETIKSFMSSSVDIYRASYGRQPVKVERSSVIAGTSNPSDFLTDPTGARRFWPIAVTKMIDCERIKRERDQLWAEARHLHDQGEPWWLQPAEEAALAEIHHEHEASDAWEHTIVNYARERTGRFTTGDVWAHAFNEKLGTLNKSDEMRIANVLSRNGFVNKGPALRATASGTGRRVQDALSPPSRSPGRPKKGALQGHLARQVAPCFLRR